MAYLLSGWALGGSIAKTGVMASRTPVMIRINRFFVFMCRIGVIYKGQQFDQKGCCPVKIIFIAKIYWRNKRYVLVNYCYRRFQDIQIFCNIVSLNYTSAVWFCK